MRGYTVVEIPTNDDRERGERLTKGRLIIAGSASFVSYTELTEREREIVKQTMVCIHKKIRKQIKTLKIAIK